MKSITKNLMLAVFMLASLSLLAQKGGKDELKKTIQDMNDKMAAAMIAGEDEKLLSFYDEKVISMPEYGKTIRGLEEMKAQQAEAKAKGNKVLAMELRTKQVTDYGEVVVEIGNYTITFQIAEASGPMSDAGKYLTVWKKYGKDYKILNEIWNTNVYPLDAMKKGNGKPDPDLKGDKKKQGQLQSDQKKNKKPKPENKDQQ